MYTCKLYTEYNTLPIPKLHQFHIMQFMHKYEFNRSSLPVLFRDFFIFNREIHDINTRQACQMHLIRVGSKFGQRFLKFSGPKLWNSIPLNIKTSKGIYTFKKKLKKMYFQELKNEWSSRQNQNSDYEIMVLYVCWCYNNFVFSLLCSYLGGGILSAHCIVCI